MVIFQLPEYLRVESVLSIYNSVFRFEKKLFND